MSYCRFSIESDVYVFCTENEEGRGVECCSCALGPPDFPMFPSADAIIAHLERHLQAGHAVPGDVIERLVEDRPRLDGWIATGSDRLLMATSA